MVKAAKLPNSGFERDEVMRIDGLGALLPDSPMAVASQTHEVRRSVSRSK